MLPYVAQEAMFHYGWLQPGQMMDGLGLAETTPGPLIMVVQFVGFVGAWQHPDGLPPLLAATLGALITTWATFTPCFLWVFLGGPHIEQLRGNEKLATALSTIAAAIVGVILNLAVWFALHVFFPRTGVLDWFALALSAFAFVGMLRWNWSVILVVLGSGALGFTLSDVCLNEFLAFRLLAPAHFPNVIITGHQAFFTRDALENIASTTIQNITAFEEGRASANEVRAIG